MGLMLPNIKRKELLADIETNVTACNNFTNTRLNNHRLLSDAIQRKFDKQFIRLM